MRPSPGGGAPPLAAQSTEAPPTEAGAGDEVIRFDAFDGGPAAPEDAIRGAPRRKPIERFQLFGEAPRPPR